MPALKPVSVSVNGEEDVAFATAVANAPITAERPYRIDTDEVVPKPYVARASLATSFEHPNGSAAWAHEHGEYSVLQQHILFWDRDGDGVIWPRDTYVGFRELGFNVFFTLLATFIINVCFSYPTQIPHTVLPDPLLRVFVDNIHKDKHGSDTGVYDTEGRFIPSRFEDIFSKYSSGGSAGGYAMHPPDSLTLREVFQMMQGQRCVADPYGWSAALFEWGSAWLLIQKDGRILKEDLRKMYDGSLFFEIRAARRCKGGWNKGWGLGGDGFIGSKKVLPFSL